MKTPPLRILLPFNDDSTLFFAQRMRDLLAPTHHQVQIVWLTDGSNLSHRQLTSTLPEGPDILLANEAFKQVSPLLQFDAIITSRMFRPLSDMIKRPFVQYLSNRPCVIAFQGGLEFDPFRGFANRRFADAVFILPKKNIHEYKNSVAESERSTQYVGFGHPTFLTPAKSPANLAERRDIYFFAQAISPKTRRSRTHILTVLAAIARANPDRKVWLKLRHLPHENQSHLHIEKYSFPELVTSWRGQGLPENLYLTGDSMDSVLDRAAIGITCTSTAAIDVLRAGIPTMVYLDYVENYLDPLVEPMRQLFAESGVISSLEDILYLRCSKPNLAWLEEMFCPANILIAQIQEAIALFKTRPVSVSKTLPELAFEQSPKIRTQT